MSSPTPGSDPNYPQGGAPQGQPAWGAPQQPVQGYGAPGSPAGYGGAPGQRPGMVTGAAVVAIVWGGLGALFGLLALSVAFILGALYGLIILISIAMSVALLVGGIFVLQGKNPKLLLMVSYIAIGVSVLSLIIGIIQSGGNAFSGVLGIIVPGVIVALLMQPQSKQYFASRGMAY
ncbi:hypothetical protein GCM10010531_31020 [Blastococcus jejuensis]|uniref:Uncharacterized protein n=1 Tax=Blastococcus jejuensis TaxID=351224 RepID=A0ABP6PCQ9_9ACTN